MQGLKPFATSDAVVVQPSLYIILKLPPLLKQTDVSIFCVSPDDDAPLPPVTDGGLVTAAPVLPPECRFFKSHPHGSTALPG